MKSIKKLPHKFYRRSSLVVAKELLGKIFVKETAGKLQRGKIVEVEAYKGSIDEAAHTFNGPTERNKVMFEQGGLLYVYFTYGMHYCSNVVTGNAGEGDAVLIRGIEPVEGIKEMSINRFGTGSINEKQLANLTNGPAKICQAFGIDKKFNGVNLVSSNIYILDNKNIQPESIITTTRIGIKKSVDLPWRFYIKDNPYVSKK